MSKPTCAQCNDTHQMLARSSSMDERMVPCTRCPVPCPKCQAGGYGAYCSETPCSCICHVPKVSNAPIRSANTCDLKIVDDQYKDGRPDFAGATRKGLAANAERESIACETGARLDQIADQYFNVKRGVIATLDGLRSETDEEFRAKIKEKWGAPKQGEFVSMGKTDPTAGTIRPKGFPFVKSEGPTKDERRLSFMRDDGRLDDALKGDRDAITFRVGDRDVLTLRASGQIERDGVAIAKDREVVDALREFLGLAPAKKPEHKSEFPASRRNRFGF